MVRPLGSVNVIEATMRRAEPWFRALTIVLKAKSPRAVLDMQSEVRLLAGRLSA